MTDLRAQLEALPGHGANRLCPAHDDAQSSLSVNLAHDPPLFHCHAGCPQSAVLRALGASQGTWVRPNEKSWLKRASVMPCYGQGRTLTYVSMTGAQHFRRGCSEHGKHLWWQKGTTVADQWYRPLTRPSIIGTEAPCDVCGDPAPYWSAGEREYRCESHYVLSGTSRKPVWLVEGEKAADALYRAGLPVLGYMGGASATPTMPPPLEGPYVYWPDNDTAGWSLMRRIRDAVDPHPRAAVVKPQDHWEKGWDAADELFADLTARELHDFAGCDATNYPTNIELVGFRRKRELTA